MSLPKYYLNENFYIKLIEFPALYNIRTDELYCLDEKAYSFIKKIIYNENLPDGISEAEDDLKDLISFCLNEGIITEKPTKRLYPEIRQSPIPSLRYLELQITKRCNLRCKHCFVGESRNIDLSLEKIKRILKEFEGMQGLRVLFTGGEPLLHPNFERINQILPEFALRKILFTNGMLVDDSLLDKLNFHEIQFSLDGMQKGHESLRGKGTFNKTLSAIRKATERGFDVSVATVVHRKNLEEFEELERLIKTLKIRDWTVDALTLTGNLRFNSEFWVEPEIAGEYMKKYGFSKEEHPRAEGYACGAHLLAVLATGKVAYCSFFEETPIGDIDEGLEVLWKRKKKILLKELECAEINCPYLQECFGGCRYRALAMTGKESSRDTFKCRQMFS